MVVIGGGIVGASTAMQLKQRYPEKSILLIEKESGPAKHQTGHNSGVVHAGVYYAPGSLKADFCKRGMAETIAFCKKHDIPYDQCGKLIVATHDYELQKLSNLYENCQTNGLQVSWVEKDQLIELEPNISGIRGFLVKDSAITDYPAITQKMIEEFERMGGVTCFNSSVTDLTENDTEVLVTLSNDTVIAVSYTHLTLPTKA